MTQPVMIMAGGTGGHVYPALAVANELQSRGVPVIWLGTQKGIEARLVPEAGISIEWLSVSGLRGKNITSLIMAPINLLLACYQSARILLKRKPCVVLGMGGFVSGPGGLMARVLKMPLLIHEQNAIPGLTNRLLSRIATKVMEAFPGSFARPAMHVGNPVRDVISLLPSPELRMRDREGSIRLLVFGGSLGAVKLNQVVPETISIIEPGQRPLIRHQAGNKNIDQTIKKYKDLNVDASVTAYIDDMSEAYAWADIVLCRAGAMTVSELAAAGVASILVPYPHAVDNHQLANAEFLSSHQAAILIDQEDLTVENLHEILSQISRDKIIRMAVNAKKLGLPESTLLVTEQCLLAGGVAC